MALFNSIGSNFTASSALRRLVGGRTNENAITSLLEKQFDGACTLTYKGREALLLALQKANLPAGSEVAVNGFTCYVVYEAVKNAGYNARFIDVEKGSLHFSAAALQQVAAAGNLKAVVVQNTLGAPCDITGIETVCRENNLVLIEDLAHSIGTVYADGRSAGTVGDFVMLSFSQDKTLDVVAGGAVIDRRRQSTEPVSASSSPVIRVASGQRLKNRLYPLFTMAIRVSFSGGVGRALRKAMHATNMLSRPMDNVGNGVHAFDAGGMKLLKQRLVTSEQEFAHRRAITVLYRELLPSDIQLPINTYGDPVMVRFPVFVSNRASLVAELKKHRWYFGDTWYDVPVGPKAFFERVGMKTEDFPNAVWAAGYIVNLPTHTGVTEADARAICATISQWLTLQ